MSTTSKSKETPQMTAASLAKIKIMMIISSFLILVGCLYLYETEGKVLYLMVLPFVIVGDVVGYIMMKRSLPKSNDVGAPRKEKQFQ